MSLGRVSLGRNTVCAPTCLKWRECQMAGRCGWTAWISEMLSRVSWFREVRAIVVKRIATLKSLCGSTRDSRTTVSATPVQGWLTKDYLGIAPGTERADQ